MNKTSKYFFSPYQLFLKEAVTSVSLIFAVSCLFSVMSSGLDIFTTDHHKLNIFQWNCRSLNTNQDQFLQHINESNYDILALQSVGSRSYSVPQIPGYHYPPYITMFDSKIRTVTYVKLGMISTMTYIKDLKYGHAVTVETKDKETVTVVNVYYPEGVQRAEYLDWMSNIEVSKYIICGDFNSHSPLWSSTRAQSDSGGSHIEAMLENVDMCILNDGTITRIPDISQHNPSAIDLTFCSSNVFMDMDWSVEDDPLGSDHLPVHITYDYSPKTISNHTHQNYIYDKANWVMFRSILERADYPDNFDAPDSWYSRFQSIVVSAANRSIPKSNNKDQNGNDKKRLNEWWNDKCQEQRSLYRRLVKNYKRSKNLDNFEEMKKQKIIYNKTLAEAKLAFWSKYLNENVQSYRDANCLYKKLRHIKGRFHPPEHPLEVNGMKTTDPKEKADILAETFSSVSQNSSLSTDQLNFRLLKETNFSKPNFKESKENTDFSEIELNRAIFGIKRVKKSTGADPISYAMIKKFPHKTKIVLLRYFNELWKSGSLPSVWKEAQVSAIPKPNKPKKDPKSYRPIALTPHISKLYERLVKNRLEYFLENNNLLPKCQSGFRRGRSCTENLVKLTSHVKRAMMRRRPVLSTFYDIKRAYDTVWHKKLLDKLYNLGVSKNIYQFVDSFLHGRIIRVSVGSEISRPHILDMGIP